MTLSKQGAYLYVYNKRQSVFMYLLYEKKNANSNCVINIALFNRLWQVRCESVHSTIFFTVLYSLCFKQSIRILLDLNSEL